MPEKEGAEEKSTKSVVNKKQKQMMGEEGYDHLRDQGRIRKNKKKKDATSYPVSDEVKKTQKVNKGPSALERVKKKYKGQIMDVKKEELDLTRVAESFGGYIVEMELDDPFGEVKPDESKPKKSSPKKKTQSKKPKITGDVQTTEKPKRVTNRMAKTFAGQDIEKETGDKFVKGPNLKNLGRSQKPKKNQKLNPYTGTIDKKTGKVTEPPVKVTKVDPKSLINNPTGAPTPNKPKKVTTKNIAKQDIGKTGVDFKSMGKPKSGKVKSLKKSKVKQATDAATDALKDMKQDTKVMGKTTPSVTREVEKIKKAANPNPTPRGRRARRYKLSPEKKAERIAREKAKIDKKNPTYIGKSGGKLPVPRPEPGMKGFKGVRKRTQRTAKKLGTKAFKAFKARPLATTIIGSEVIDRVSAIAGRIPKPSPPRLDVGVVGRRTAG